MPIILRHFPFVEKRRTIHFQGREFVVKANQLAVWMSLSDSKKTPGKQPIPVLIDTGFGHTFAIHADQLYNWSRLHPTYHSRPMRFNEIAYSVAPQVFIWLYRKWSISSHELANEEPILLRTGGLGIAVNTQVVTSGAASNARPFPRLPLLGMKTLRQNRLRLFVDAWKSQFSLYQGRIWPWQ